jgi:hypothetical protein
MPIDSTGRARTAEHVFAREFDGEIVLLDLERGEYYGLDALGARLWRGLGAGQTPRQVAEEAAPEYDVELDTLVHDLVRLARDLEARGLVIPIDGG